MDFDGPEVGGGVAVHKGATEQQNPSATSSPGVAVGGAPKNDFTDHGGRIIQSPKVVLIFWGTAWASIPPPIPSPGEIADAVSTIATGQYTDSLRQYRGISRGSLQQVAYVTSAVGSAPASPPNPFSDGDVHQVINELCSAGRVPSPANDGNLFYCVITPTNTANTNANFIGEHTYSTIAGVRAHWSWVTNNGSLNSVTSIFSHELVEAATDPEGDGWTGNVCNQGGWCEIGDVCGGNTAIVDGVIVQRYWSNADGQCVVPTDPIVKSDKDTKDTKDRKDKDKDIKDRKDRKETKDSKEKEKDAKEKDRDQPPVAATLEGVMTRLDEVSRRLAALESGSGSLPSFIEPTERPEVGGGVLKDES